MILTYSVYFGFVRVDIHEGPAASNTIVASFELPGLTKEDISIELHPNSRLTITGEHKEEVVPSSPERTDEASQEKPSSTPVPSEPTYYVRERRTGKFERTIAVPEGTKVRI